MLLPIIKERNVDDIVVCGCLSVEKAWNVNTVICNIESSIFHAATFL